MFGIDDDVLDAAASAMRDRMLERFHTRVGVADVACCHPKAFDELSDILREDYRQGALAAIEVVHDSVHPEDH